MQGCTINSRVVQIRRNIEAVADSVSEPDTFSSLIGAEIMSLITAGMYNNPLALYREYIQNAADAAGVVGDATVTIDIDTSVRRIRIHDNGPGLSRQAATRALVPIAQSQKTRGLQRGFRGIGRLAGLAFAESVTFTTRADGDEIVTRITWDGRKLRSVKSATSETDQWIGECVHIETVATQQFPDHFFEVEINGVGRHVASLILNREMVRAYIGEVCPVPFSAEFPFASEVESVLPSDARVQKLNVMFQGEVVPVTKRYGKSIPFANNRESCFTELEAIRIPALDGRRTAVVGWIAHSPYLGAIPKSAGIRGIRARCGDIQVGDERTFDSLFKEERFNRWCVGEIHILDPRIVPNGRRDYFELGPHVRHLENQLGPVVQNISERCRNASLDRNRKRKLLDEISRLEDFHDLVSKGYLTHEDSRALAVDVLQQVHDVRGNLASRCSHTDEHFRRLDSVEEQLNCVLTAPTKSVFGDASPLEVATYQRTFRALAEVSGSPRAARELIEAVLCREHIIDDCETSRRGSSSVRTSEGQRYPR